MADENKPRKRLSTMNTMQLADEKVEKKTPCFIQPHYSVPRKPIARAIEAVADAENPGLINEATLKSMAVRFCETFGGPDFFKDQKTSAQMDETLMCLRERTARRHGAEIVGSGVVDWQHNVRRVFSMFDARLNIFERIFFTVDVGESSSTTSRICSIFLIFTIIISIVLWMVSTLPECQEECVIKTIQNCTTILVGDNETSTEVCNPYIDPSSCLEAPRPIQFFRIMEVVCIYIFTVEYVVKIGTAHSVRFELNDEDFIENLLMTHEEEATKLDNKLMTTVKFMIRASSMIDLLSILPFWVEQIAGSSGGNVFVILRILRLTRIFRVFKVGKYNEIFSLLGRVVQQSTPALFLMIFFILIGLCLFGSLIWMTEQGTWYPQNHPEVVALGITDRGAYLLDTSLIDGYNSFEETKFASIMHSFWFVIVTITTAGYGDLYPQRPMGKFVGSLMILSGIVVLAMPVGVIGSNFSSEYEQIQAAAGRRKKEQAQKESEQELVRQALTQQKAEAQKQAEVDGSSRKASISSDDSEEEEPQWSTDVALLNGLLDMAMRLENEISDLLPDEAKFSVQHDLRAFLHQVVASRDEPVSKELHSDLDDLVFGILGHLRSILSHEAGAVPTKNDILECRRHLIEFATEIENYWTEHPARVQEGSRRPPGGFSAARDLLDMKAQLSLTMYNLGSQQNTSAPGPSPAGGSHKIEAPATSKVEADKEEKAVKGEKLNMEKVETPQTTENSGKPAAPPEGSWVEVPPENFDKKKSAELADNTPVAVATPTDDTRKNSKEEDVPGPGEEIQKDPETPAGSPFQLPGMLG